MSEKSSFNKSLQSIIYLRKLPFSEGAEIFRENFIRHFSPDNQNNELKYNFNDNFDCLDEFARFKFYSHRNRVKNFNYSADLTIKSRFHSLRKFLKSKIVNQTKFEYFILFLMILDSISIAICVNYKRHLSFSALVCLTLIQYIFLTVFLIDICLKLFIDFNSFWKSAWNKFDFWNLCISIFLQLIDLFINIYLNIPNKSTNRFIEFLKFLTIFRIFSNLKILSYFIELRIIVICLTRAVRSVVLISILLFIFAYIFAKIGYILYSSDTTNNYFSSLFESLITLFAIMTLDQWWKIFSKTSESSNNSFVSNFYFISWVMLASFIFQNLFTGVMVNNFQQIRDEVVKSMDKKLIKKVQKESLRQESKKSSILDDVSSQEDRFESIFTDLDQVLFKMRTIRVQNKEWTLLIEQTCDLIQNLENCTIWPEDTLLRYYEVMEILMDNLKERMDLVDLANKSLTSMHDRDCLLEDKKNFIKILKLLLLLFICNH